jgi:hypothetical protein
MQDRGIERIAFYGVSDEMEVAYITLQGAQLKLVGIVEDGSRMNEKEVFGLEVKEVSQIEVLKPDAVLITSLLGQEERTETLKQFIDAEKIQIYNISAY